MITPLSPVSSALFLCQQSGECVCVCLTFGERQGPHPAQVSSVSQGSHTIQYNLKPPINLTPESTSLDNGRKPKKTHAHMERTYKLYTKETGQAGNQTRNCGTTMWRAL